MLIMIRCCNIAILHSDILFRIIIDLVSTKAPPDMHAANKTLFKKTKQNTSVDYLSASAKV